MPWKFFFKVYTEFFAIRGTVQNDLYSDLKSIVKEYRTFQDYADDFHAVDETVDFNHDYLFDEINIIEDLINN